MKAILTFSLVVTFATSAVMVYFAICNNLLFGDAEISAGEVDPVRRDQVVPEEMFVVPRTTFTVPLVRVAHPRRSLRDRTPHGTSRGQSEDMDLVEENFSPSSCSDDDVACPFWAKKGLCHHTDDAEFVRSSCSKSCEKCHETQADKAQAIAMAHYRKP